MSCGPPVATVAQLAAWACRFGDLIAEHRDQLTELDSAIGDADHGANMDRGMKAVRAKLDAGAPEDAGELFKLVGMTLVSTVGGASGPLYGTFFLRFATACGGRAALAMDNLVAAFGAGVDGIVARGHADPGDKTMLDTLQPAVAALARAARDGLAPGEGFALAWQAAERGRDLTIPMVARKGRASYLGPRSAGHQDPGATSAALLFEAVAAVFGT